MLMQDEDTGEVFWVEEGKEYPVQPGEIPALLALQADQADAKKVGSLEAGMLSMGDRVLNAINTLVPESWEGHQSKVMGNLIGAATGTDRTDMPHDTLMTQIKDEHPVASTVGDIAPYMLAAPVAATSVPAMLTVGMGTGALLADKGDEARDAAIGLLTAGTGSVTSKVANKVVGAFKYKPAKEFYKKAANKLEGAMANNAPEVVLDNLDTIKANAKAMKKLSEKNARETPTLLKQLSAGRIAAPGLFDVGADLFEEKAN